MKASTIKTSHPGKVSAGLTLTSGRYSKSKTKVKTPPSLIILLPSGSKVGLVKVFQLKKRRHFISYDIFIETSASIAKLLIKVYNIHSTFIVQHI